MPAMSLLARVAAVAPFGGLSPFGPIFGKELRVTSRRRRTYALRVGYLGLLLLAMLLAYTATSGRSYGGVAQQTMRQAELGHAFFVAFAVFCIGSMGLIGPVLTANAIGAERLAKTLPVLLMTPITAWQVVSGKLLSRALTALTLIGLSLPVLALVRLLGGVELDLMLAALAVAVSYMLACAALGLFYSLFISRAAVVILLSYATLGGLYLLLPAVLFGLFRIDRWDVLGRNGAMQLLLAINPSAWSVITAEGRAGPLGMTTWLPCVLVQLGLAAGLVLWTAVLLRRQFRAAGEGDAPAVPAGDSVRPALTPAAERPGPVAPAGPPPLPNPENPAAQRPAWGATESAGESGLSGLPSRISSTPAPALSYASSATRNPRAAKRGKPVSDNPVLWRETRRPLFAKLWQRVLCVCLVLGVLGLMYAVLAEGRDLNRTESQIGFAIVFCLLWWLVSAVLSATAISQEKESDTWTLLLTTPLTGRQVVFGKAAGMYRRMLWPTVLFAAHFLLFAIAGVVPLWGVVFGLGMIVASNSLWIATGIWISLRIRRVTFAVIANLLLAVGLYGLLPLAVYIPAELVARREGESAEHAMWVNPYYFLGSGFEGMHRVRQRRTQYYGAYGSSNAWYYNREPYRVPREEVDLPAFLLAAGSCAGLHLLAAYLVLSWTAGQFDEIVGRAGRRRFAGTTFDSDASVLPELESGGVGVGGDVVGGNGTAGTAAGVLARGAGSELSASSPARAAGTAAPQLGRSAASSDTAASVYAGFWLRAGAFAIDVSLLGIVCLLGGIAWGVVTVVLAVDGQDVAEDAVAGIVGSRMVYAGWLGLALGWVYFAGYEASAKRATPGKSFVGLFVTDAQGRRATFARTSLRYAAKLASAVPLLAGFALAGFGRRKRALHDLVAGTLVLKR